MIIARIDDHGAPKNVADVPTAKGARNPVVDAAGTAYVEDSLNGKLLVVRSPPGD